MKSINGLIGAILFAFGALINAVYIYQLLYKLAMYAAGHGYTDPQMTLFIGILIGSFLVGLGLWLIVQSGKAKEKLQ